MTAPVGTMALARQNMANTLADADAFRALVGADTQAEALKRIHDTALPPPGDGNTYTLDEMKALRPFAIVSTQSLRKVGTAGGVTTHFADSGGLTLHLEMEVPEDIANNAREIALRFENVIGQIMDDVGDLAGGAGYLDITDIGMETPWARTPENEIKGIGDAVFVELTVQWGRQR